ncbi:hypothetical protein L6452_26635 [Arctium lappa]|uniref:Uncharacterized protein n=1 Tax=Arctium lappa TaxID=4217 RepID=A0ACB8ZVV5_ARCLA|nr:hypothetical protein L6452_26635 [Arctium lappa]
MTGSNVILVVVIIAVVASTQFQTTVAQTRHVVGDTLGWGVNPAAAYATWASGQNFTVGDSLFFNFTTGFHDVTEVTQGAFGPCTTTNPINTTTTGPATVVLTTAGAHYYICTVGLHCQNGQKLSINVGEASASTPPSSSPSPPDAGSTTPPPSPPSSSTPPSPSDASPSLTTVVPITLLAGALGALFY